jgi:putative Holliday junction resolvase
VEAVTAARRGRVLGVDLGSRRIGLALSDPGRTVASPHDVLTRSGDRERDHRSILEIARREGADVVVVGLPLSLSGRKGPAARAALEEVEELRHLAGAGVTVEVCDERLTTVVAERALGEARMKRRDRRQVVDKVAASVMLQSYLEQRR